MIEFGKTLRAAREAKGMTVRQIADTTHMPPNMVTDLENEDFSRIPAPIYGRGFVKLYCECVGLDPKPLLFEFMEILNGNREISIRERPAASSPAPIAPQEKAQEPVAFVAPFKAPVAPPQQPLESIPQASAATVPPPAQPMTAPLSFESQVSQKRQNHTQNDFFTSEPEPLPPPMPEAVVPPCKPLRAAVQPPPLSPMPEMEQLPLPESEPTLSRYATPVKPAIAYSAGLSYWRIFLLGAVAIVIILILLFGIRMLYRATSATKPGEPAAADIVAPAKPDKAVKPATATKPAAAPAPVKTAPTAKKPTPVATPAAKRQAAADAKPAKARKPQKISSLYID